MNTSKTCKDWFANCFKKNENKIQDQNKFDPISNKDILTNIIISPDKAITRVSLNQGRETDKEYRLELNHPDEILIKKIKCNKEYNENKNYKKVDFIDKEKEANTDPDIDKENIKKCKNCHKRVKIILKYLCCNEPICIDCIQTFSDNDYCCFCNKEQRKINKLFEGNKNILQLNKVEDLKICIDNGKIMATLKKNNKIPLNSSQKKHKTKLNEFSKIVNKINFGKNVFEYDKRSRSFDNGEYYEINNRIVEFEDDYKYTLIKENFLSSNSNIKSINFIEKSKMNGNYIISINMKKNVGNMKRIITFQRTIEEKEKQEKLKEKNDEIDQDFVFERD